MIICISCLTYCCYNEHKLPYGLQKCIFYNQNLENFSKLPIANKQLGTYLSKQIERNNKWYEVNNTAYHETAIFHAVAKVLCLIISITDTMLRPIITNLKCFMTK